MTKPPIIAFDQNDWFETWMNRQQILTRLAARDWPTVYSNGRFSIWERHYPYFRKLGLTSRSVRSDGVLIHNAGKLHASFPNRPVIDAITRKLYFRSLKRAVSSLPRAAGRQRPVVCIFHPEYEEFLDLYEDAVRVLYLRDMYHVQGMSQGGVVERLNRIAQRCDLIFATTPETAEPLDEEHRGKLTIVLNAGSYEAFAAGSEMPEPEELVDIPRPRIGFFGSINRRLDLGLIREVSAERPDWQWVLVGPLRFGDANDPQDVQGRMKEWAETSALSNVHYLGPKPFRRLPAFAASMDVNTLIYLVSDPKVSWVRGAYPLKLHEYLATGLPVVSVELQNLRQHDDVIEFATGTEDWVEKLEAAIGGRTRGSPEARRAVAKANDWDSRVDVIEERISSVLEGGG